VTDPVLRVRRAAVRYAGGIDFSAPRHARHPVREDGRRAELYELALRIAAAIPGSSIA
jgi:hypothetical protein